MKNSISGPGAYWAPESRWKDFWGLEIVLGKGPKIKKRESMVFDHTPEQIVPYSLYTMKLKMKP